MDFIAHIESIQTPLTAQELAPILGCSPKTIYKMAASGRIPSYRIGSMVRFCPAEIAAWLRAQHTGQQSRHIRIDSRAAYRRTATKPRKQTPTSRNYKG